MNIENIEQTYTYLFKRTFFNTTPTQGVYSTVEKGQKYHIVCQC